MDDLGQQLCPHPASFRDPDSRVYVHQGRVLRFLSPAAEEEYESFRDSGLLHRMVEQGRLVPTTESGGIDINFAEADCRPSRVLEHKQIPFVSYPYEWSFRALQAAALLHLEIQLEALSSGFTLSDASAYNVQFEGARPVFIDVGSFRRYREGEAWVGHRQFCEQFLNPLLLQALTGVPYQQWYRGTLEGIPGSELSALLPLRKKLRWLVLTHVVMQDWLQRSAKKKPTTELRALAARSLPRRSFKALLEQLRRGVARLRPAGTDASVWLDYESTRTYDSCAMRDKKAAVVDFVGEVRPAMLFDLGCNTGEYSLEAAQAGAAYVVGFDSDSAALDKAFCRSQRSGARFLPLYLDAANPSPGQGWRHRERASIEERARGSAVIALAFEHHLTIGRNVPIPAFIDWLVGLAPTGLVEFVEKTDPTVQKMLALRKDIFKEYSLDSFEFALAKRARICKRERLAGSSRWIFRYETV